MRIRSKAVTVLAAAGLLLGVGLVSAGNAGAASSWTPFGSGTGVQQVNYNGFTSYINKTGSGIVEQWVAPGALGGSHGAYYLFKPLSGQAGSTTVSTPFKQSCDSQGLVGTAFPGVWTYSSGNYTPAGVIADYFPYDGLKYWVCQYDMSNWATGSVDYFLLGVNRHVTFEVQMAAPGAPAHGTMNYSDGATSYSIVVDAVYISGNTVTFSGFYPTGSTTQWLVLQAVNSGGLAVAWGGDVVSSDPSATLSTYSPGLVGTGVTGTMTVYTR